MCEHTVERMVESNWFKLDSSASEWRSELSLRGLSSLTRKARGGVSTVGVVGVGSEDEHAVDPFVDELVIGYSATEEKPSPAMAMAVHDTGNALMVASRPTLSMTEVNCGKLELFELDASRTDATAVDGRTPFDDDLMMAVDQHMVDSVRGSEHG